MTRWLRPKEFIRMPLLVVCGILIVPPLIFMVAIENNRRLGEPIKKYIDWLTEDLP